MKRLLMLVMILLLASSSFAKPPWDEHGKLKMEIKFDGSCDAWSNIWANIPDHYITRFGAYPQFMLWDDIDQPVLFVMDFGFLRYNNPNPHLNPPLPDWSMDLTWADVKQHFYWRTESVLKGDVFYYPVTQHDDTTHISSTKYDANGDWFVHFNFDARTLPIPNDDSAWKLNLQVFDKGPAEGDPPAISSDTVIVIRTTRSTPTDTLMWSRYADILDEDKNMNMQLLRHFPNSRIMLLNMIFIYAEEANCDSLQFYCQRYIDVSKARSDPHYVTNDLSGVTHSQSSPITHADYDFIQELLFETCGDSLDIVRDVPPIEEEYNQYELVH